MKWLAVAGVLLIALAVVWTAAFPTATVRYRLTLEAEVDGQPATGSSVIEVSYRKNPQFLGAQSELIIGVRGEAVTVDLGSRGTLFAPLRAGKDPRSGPEYIVLRAFGLPYANVPRPIEQGLAQILALKGKATLPPDSLPLLVRFGDISDPKTVELVDPNDLEKSFGPGTKLIRATVEIVPAGIWPMSWYGITGEPTTDEIKRKISWLPQYYDRQLDGRRYETIEAPNRFSNSLNAADFKRGK